MSIEAALARARHAHDGASAIEELARTALAEGGEEVALPLVRAQAERRREARLWQWTALLERALDEHANSLTSFCAAAELDPADASVAHGLARVALEAGIPAVELFEHAVRLSPTSGEVLLGYAAALFAGGRGERAEAVLESALARSPYWLQGHTQLAQLKARLGRRHLATESLERALRSHASNQLLWTTLFDILVRAENFEELDEAVVRARGNVQPEGLLLQYEAIAASERSEFDRADRLFSQLDGCLASSAQIWRIRHLLRTARVSDAVSAVDSALAGPEAAAVWPYASITWRLANDPRWAWLEGHLDPLISVMDLSADVKDIRNLELALRQLHSSQGEYLDQSVRGGSQTDGPLFARVDPAIRALRTAIVGAVWRYVESLPPSDPRHPLLAARRDRSVRFSGSWSVLLRSGGHHANHVHPEGWVSSAFYVALPQQQGGNPGRDGWLSLGEPQERLALNLPAFRHIQPRTGQLVLFPSWMWHGTVPFETGERLTVAFDVRRPI